MERDTGRVFVTRDGAVQAGPMSENEAFAWLLRHQPHSVSHALQYEGWRFEPECSKFDHHGWAEHRTYMRYGSEEVLYVEHRCRCGGWRKRYWPASQSTMVTRIVPDDESPERYEFMSAQELATESKWEQWEQGQDQLSDFVSDAMWQRDQEQESV